MRQYCKKLCRQMQAELTRCNDGDICCFEKNIECCFGVANRYWSRVQEKLRQNGFKSEEAEIEFFKVIKPKFTSEIEYYSLVYHCLIFQPSDLLKAVQFLGKELKRWVKFEEENRSFIECFRSVGCELNRFYFLRKYYTCTNELEISLYDADLDVVTNGDPLVATMMALERYKEFVKERLAGMDK
jgi:hypothetical protein